MQACGTPALHIILAEDSRSDVMLVRLALREAGLDCDLQVVGDGEKAIELLDRLDRDPNLPPIDLLIVDLNLPKCNGEEVLARLRATRRNGRARAIVLSGSLVEADYQGVRKLGVLHCFQKPASLAEYLRLGTMV